MRKCTKCLIVKEFSEFQTSTRNKIGLDPQCMACKKVYDAGRYMGRKEYVKEASKKRYWSDKELHSRKHKERRDRYFKEWFTHFPSDLKIECSACGYDKHFSALDFHHVGVKNYLVSALMARRPTDERIEVFKEEVSQCIILCANCHREEHFGE